MARQLWLSIGLLLAITVFIGSLLPPSSTGQGGFPLNDKAIHLIAYFILSAWFILAYSNIKKRQNIVILLVLLGFSIEVIQWKISYRSGSSLDMLMNVIGIILGLLVADVASKMKLFNWLSP